MQISRLEFLHSRGLVHGDVKPHHFAIWLKEDVIKKLMLMVSTLCSFIEAAAYTVGLMNKKDVFMPSKLSTAVFDT